MSQKRNRELRRIARATVARVLAAHPDVPAAQVDVTSTRRAVEQDLRSALAATPHGRRSEACRRAWQVARGGRR